MPLDEVSWDVSGSLTSIPFWTMGVITMKMINRTSNTSHNGTTLGSAEADILASL